MSNDREAAEQEEGADEKRSGRRWSWVVLKKKCAQKRKQTRPTRTQEEDDVVLHHRMTTIQHSIVQGTKKESQEIPNRADTPHSAQPSSSGNAPPALASSLHSRREPHSSNFINFPSSGSEIMASVQRTSVCLALFAALAALCSAALVGRIFGGASAITAGDFCERPASDVAPNAVRSCCVMSSGLSCQLPAGGVVCSVLLLQPLPSFHYANHHHVVSRLTRRSQTSSSTRLRRTPSGGRSAPPISPVGVTQAAPAATSRSASRTSSRIATAAARTSSRRDNALISTPRR